MVCQFAGNEAHFTTLINFQVLFIYLFLYILTGSSASFTTLISTEN